MTNAQKSYTMTSAQFIWRHTMINAQFVFNLLTKQDMINVVAFMEENKDATLAATIYWLYEVIDVDGEDVICERDHDHDLPYAAHMRQWRMDVCARYNLDDIDDDEALPF